MGIIYTNKETNSYTDIDGKTTVTTKETTRQVSVCTEPDYIKVYTKMWCEFNQIPQAFRELFFQLAIRMSYCDKADIEHSQTVITYGSVKTAIQAVLGWKDSMYYKGLQALCDCGAIRKLSRSEYQINPNYAARGGWKYNPQTHNGGVEDLVAVFNFRNHTIQTDVIWADDGTNSELNDIYRKGLNVRSTNKTVLSSATIKLNSGQQTELDNIFKGA